MFHCKLAAPPLQLVITVEPTTGAGALTDAAGVGQVSDSRREAIWYTHTHTRACTLC